tara:strand:+ start:1072 stop:1731 length:660 start_codon:yes stop_codon:yes gene_type:complete
MHNRCCWIISGVFLAVCAAAITPACASDFVEVQGDHFCPAERRLMSYSYAVRNKEQICNSLNDWTVARLAGDGSMSGAGNNCEIYAVDHRALGSSLCISRRDSSSIRGVLLQGGFRSQDALTNMSEQDWRVALETELTKRTFDQRSYFQNMTNEAVAGAGALLVHHLKFGNLTPSEIAKLSLDDLRDVAIFDLNKQTGIPVGELRRMSDGELVELFTNG